MQPIGNSLPTPHVSPPGMDDGEVPLEGDGHRGPDGAVEGDLHQGQRPGHQVGVHPHLHHRFE